MGAANDRSTARERAIRQWERFTSWPFLVLSGVFIVFYSIRCLNTHLSSTAQAVVDTVLITIWALFVVDYLGRLVLSTHRWSFVRNNVPDLLAALLPIFRPFRALKELHRIDYFRRHTGAAVRARVVSYSVVFVVLWIYTISVSVVAAERGAPGATIVSLGDAIYWAIVTMATVGYGDLVPVTTLGRTLAVGLMMSGVVIVGVTTATVVSYLGDSMRSRNGGQSGRDENDSNDSDQHLDTEPQNTEPQEGERP